MYKLIEEFYKENRTLLLKRISRRAGGMENAEDVLQEAFYKALKYNSSFDTSRNEMGAWFNTILNNTLATHQKMVMLKGLSMPYEEEIHGEVYECDAEKRDMLDKVVEKFSAGNQSTRNILHLHFSMGYTINEIREVVDATYKVIQMTILRFNQKAVKEYKGE